MNTLTKRRFFIFSEDGHDIEGVDNAGIGISAKECHSVQSYQELLYKIAALNYYNPSLQLYYRGQNKDHYWTGPTGERVRSGLHPSILRELPFEHKERQDEVKKRISILDSAEALLKSTCSIPDVHRHRLVSWAIIQHYNVCATPLIDVTTSLQIALSFASSINADGFLFIFALPHQSGPISVSLDSMIQVVDLTRICPPEVTRPHFQSALFLADYPVALDANEFSKKDHRVSSNFACRLLTKFRVVS